MNCTVEPLPMVPLYRVPNMRWIINQCVCDPPEILVHVTVRVLDELEFTSQYSQTSEPFLVESGNGYIRADNPAK